MAGTPTVPTCHPCRGRQKGERERENSREREEFLGLESGALASSFNLLRV